MNYPRQRRLKAGKKKATTEKKQNENNNKTSDLYVQFISK